MKIFLISLILCISCYINITKALDIRPAVIYDVGAHLDPKSNQIIYQSIERYKKNTGIPYLYFNIQNVSQRYQSLHHFASIGMNPIITVGFSDSEILEEISETFPTTKFITLNIVIKKPNVYSIIYKQNEGPFLVGVAAAKASNTGKIGFVGGMDNMMTRKLAFYYTKGAKYINPKVTISYSMTGTTASAWNDPMKGIELVNTLLSKGIDVIYNANINSGTGNGVQQQVAHLGKLSISIGSKNNTGALLIPILNKVSSSIYKTLENMKNNIWNSTIDIFDIKTGGLDWIFDSNHEAMISDKVIKTVYAAKDNSKMIFDSHISKH